MYKTKEDIMQAVNDHAKEVSDMGYEWVMVGLVGSQNYNLEYEYSDIDTKAILLPKFEDFCLVNSPISTTYIMENNEHVDLKDIRLMFECFKKQNTNFIEILFSKYKVINPLYQELFQPIIDYREFIAHYNNYAAINSFYGMVCQKYNALEHPYPTLLDKIEKFGYDPKQLHHILRISEFIERYVNGESYKNCLIPRNTEYLIDVKRGCYCLEAARRIAKEHVDKIEQIKVDYLTTQPLQINKEVVKLLDDVLVNLLKYSFMNKFREM